MLTFGLTNMTSTVQIEEVGQDDEAGMASADEGEDDDAEMAEALANVQMERNAAKRNMRP